jgi:hypothetical protein
LVLRICLIHAWGFMSKPNASLNLGLNLAYEMLHTPWFKCFTLWMHGVFCYFWNPSYLKQPMYLITHVELGWMRRVFITYQKCWYVLFILLTIFVNLSGVVLFLCFSFHMQFTFWHLFIPCHVLYPFVLHDKKG